MTNHCWTVIDDDVRILRGLYARQREIAAEPVMAERRRQWTALADLHGECPMILAETSGVLDEWLPKSVLQCQEDWARSLEYGLRILIGRHERVNDDYVVEPWINCNWRVTVGDYGYEVAVRRGDNEGKLGSYSWEPPIKNLDTDLARLHPRPRAVDRESTLAWKRHLETLFGDILPVRIRGTFYWTLGLTWRAIELVGLEGLMMAMYDNPAGLHRLMALLRDDHLALVEWLESEGLYSLNDENDYVGSGTLGYTSVLPQPDRDPGDPVRARDLWMLSESQETVGVSPRLFEKFVFAYQLPIIERFGLCYYGCCEPVHARWPILKQIPNLRRVSVSPWCDQAYMAEQLGQDYVYCRKPSPALISTPCWDEEALRRDIRETLEVAGECPLEIVMKDVHTLSGEPWRLGRWVAIAREECARFGGGSY